MMVAIRNLHVEYGQWPVQQMYENVLNNVVNVANCLGVSLATPYIAIRCLEDIGSSDVNNINS
jgi:hypothetical protein